MYMAPTAPCTARALKEVHEAFKRLLMVQFNDGDSKTAVRSGGQDLLVLPARIDSIRLLGGLSPV